MLSACFVHSTTRNICGEGRIGEHAKAKKVEREEQPGDVKMLPKCPPVRSRSCASSLQRKQRYTNTLPHATIRDGSTAVVPLSTFVCERIYFHANCCAFPVSSLVPHYLFFSLPYIDERVELRAGDVALSFLRPTPQAVRHRRPQEIIISPSKGTILREVLLSKTPVQPPRLVLLAVKKKRERP